MNQTKKMPPSPRHIRDIQSPLAAGVEKKPVRKFIPASRRLRLAIALVVILVAIVFVRNYMQTRSELKRASDPQTAAQDEATKLASEIGKFLELPQGEAPTVAVVKDVDKLQQQPFFKYARNGDKLLIYPNAGKAVIYRPSIKKVIEYAPVSLEDASKTP